jgi:hypothetical protein
VVDDRSAALSRTDVSVLLVADGPEPGLLVAVGSVLAALDVAARAAAASGGGATDGAAGGATATAGLPGCRLRGDRLGGELVLAVRDVAALPPGLPRSDPRLRVVAVPGAGGGRARNVAAGAARGRYVLLTTPDARVPERWVVAMVEPLRTGRADLVAGTHRVGTQRAGTPAGVAPSRAAADVRPAAPDLFPASSCGATRAVLEALGFDDALGTARSPDPAVTVVFHADAVSAGFRAQVVVGVPVDRTATRRDRRAASAAARDRGRTDAYLDRYVRTRPSPRGRAGALVGLARGVLRLAGAVCVGGVDARLGARAEVAREREAVRLAGLPDRDRPRSAAGDLVGGPGGARSAVPAALVARGSVPPTVLPPPALLPPVTAGVGTGRGVGPVGGPGRGAAHLLWPAARGTAPRSAPVLAPRTAAGPR